MLKPWQPVSRQIASSSSAISSGVPRSCGINPARPESRTASRSEIRSSPNMPAIALTRPREACVSMSWSGLSISTVARSTPNVPDMRVSAASMGMRASMSSRRRAASSRLPATKGWTAKVTFGSPAPPPSRAAARICAMKAFMRFRSGWMEKITSAWVTAKRCPRPDEPAWKSTGRACGDGRTEGVARQRKYRPSCAILSILEGSASTPAALSAAIASAGMPRHSL